MVRQTVQLELNSANQESLMRKIYQAVADEIVCRPSVKDLTDMLVALKLVHEIWRDFLDQAGIKISNEPEIDGHIKSWVKSESPLVYDIK